MSEQRKPAVREAIAVEGRYDKNTLSQVVDALIIETNGFSVFHDKEKLQALRELALERGLVLLTDADPAGAMIRSRLTGLLREGRILQAYIPELAGRERRKRRDSAYGVLGVEGMKPQVILHALASSGAQLVWPDMEGDAVESDADSPGNAGKSAASTRKSDAENKHAAFTTTDFYRLGLSGKPYSAALRGCLARTAGLPRTMNQSDLRRALAYRMTYDDLERLTLSLREKTEKIMKSGEKEED